MKPFSICRFGGAVLVAGAAMRLRQCVAGEEPGPIFHSSQEAFARLRLLDQNIERSLRYRFPIVNQARELSSWDVGAMAQAGDTQLLGYIDAH